MLVILPQPKFQKLLSRDPRSSLTTRQEIWQTSWLLVKERPVTGWGLGNFQASYRSHTKYITLTPLEWFVVKAHNLYLNLWIEVGLLGLLVFIYLILLMRSMGPIGLTGSILFCHLCRWGRGIPGWVSSYASAIR